MAGWEKLVLSTENLRSRRERHDEGENNETSWKLQGRRCEWSKGKRQSGGNRVCRDGKAAKPPQSWISINKRVHLIHD